MIEKKFKWIKVRIWICESEARKRRPKPQNKGQSQGGETQDNCWNYKKRKTPWRERRTWENGVSSIRAPLTTQVSVGPSSHWWLSYRLLNQMHVPTLSQNQTRGMIKESRSLMRNPMPLWLPPRSRRMSLKIQRRGNTSFTQRCGWKVLRCSSLLTMGAKITSFQRRSWSGWAYQWQHISSHTPSSGFTKDNISMSASSATFPTTSSPSRMRYYVMLLLLKFVMYY